MIALANIQHLGASSYSDLYKDVYGSRPRDVKFTSESEFASDYDYLCGELDRQLIEGNIAQRLAISDFELQLNDIMFYTNNMDRKDAIRFLIQAEKLEKDFEWYGYEVVEHNLNLPYGYINGSFR